MRGVLAPLLCAPVLCASVLCASVLCASVLGASLAVPRPAALSPRAGFDVTGYLEPVASAAALIAASAGAVRTVAIDDSTVTNAATSITAPDAAYAADARAAGERAVFVVSNWQRTDFSATLAARALLPAHRRLLVRAIGAAVAAGHWDGVTIDFENLVVDDRAALVALVAELRAELPAHELLAVDVPASSDPQDPYIAPYDDAALARQATLVLMAYDEHYQGGAPGPIAGCRWVRASLEVALRSVPPGRLELGEAGYGYRWFPGRLGATAQVSDRQARSLAAAHGVRPRWISSACEWRAVLPDHSIIWWSDRRAQQLDTALAHARKLAGVAVWALDLSDPL